MANLLYQTYKTALHKGLVNLETAVVKAVLVDGDDYTPDVSSTGDEFLSDIPAGARVATTAALANKTLTNGTFDADDIALPDTGGDQAELLVLFIDTGAEATSRLICKIDTASGLPITPDSVEDQITWPVGGIYAL